MARRGRPKKNKSESKPVEALDSNISLDVPKELSDYFDSLVNKDKLEFAMLMWDACKTIDGEMSYIQHNSKLPEASRKVIVNRINEIFKNLK